MLAKVVVVSVDVVVSFVEVLDCRVVLNDEELVELFVVCSALVVLIVVIKLVVGALEVAFSCIIKISDLCSML